MIVVVGAAAVDLIARRERFLAGTSNPAAIRWAPGGVGYRIWRRLPAPRLLLSAVGDDPAGRWLEKRIGKEAQRRLTRRANERARPGPRSGARLLRLPRLRHGLLLRLHAVRAAAVRGRGHGGDREGPHLGAPAGAPAQPGSRRPAGAGGQPVAGPGGRAAPPIRRAHPGGVRGSVRGEAPAARAGFAGPVPACR